MSDKSMGINFEEGIDIDIEPEMVIGTIDEESSAAAMDEELPDIKETTTTQPTKAVSTQKTATVAPLVDFDFNFGAIANLPGVVVGDVGLEVSRFPVERAKFTLAKKDLIAIVSGKVVAIKTHYNEDLGNYLCFGGKCCEHDGLPRIKYVFPSVVYDTTKAGKPVSKELQYRVLSIGKDVYEDVMTISDLQGDITSVDLLITCKDEQYQKITPQAAGDARWKKDPNLVAQVVAFWKEHMKDLLAPVARTVTEKDFIAKIEVDAGPSDSDVDFSEVFDTK